MRIRIDARLRRNERDAGARERVSVVDVDRDALSRLSIDEIDLERKREACDTERVL
jgi:hypothetical protein